MQIRLDGSTVRRSLRAAWAYLLVLCGLVYGGCVWLLRRGRTGLRSVGRWVRSLWRALTEWASRAYHAETTNRMLGRVKRGLVGVRTDISVAALLTTPVLAFVTGWWVANVAGYRRLESMAVGTWTGANPEPFVFLGVGVLVAVAALFTAVNSGVLPATALAMAPAFGIGFARYGHSVQYYGTVGIPDATAIGAMVALVVGLPLGVAGFVLGTVLRRVGHYFDRPADGEASIRA